LAIKSLHVRNFKSFARLDVSFGDFNVLVGANASGKSNFLQLFRFVKDIAQYDLDNAISLQGGVKYLRNLSLGSSEDTYIELQTDEKLELRLRGPELYALSSAITHTLALQFNPSGSSWKTTEDSVTAKLNFYRRGSRPRALASSNGEQDNLVGKGDLTVAVRKRRPEITLNMEEGSSVPINIQHLVPPYRRDIQLPRGQILSFGSPFLYYLLSPHPAQDYLRRIGLYDFDPKLPKRAIPITGRSELEEDASNLALVLRTVLQDRKKKRILSDLVTDILPFVKDIDIERFADKSLLFKISEKYFTKKEFLPASLISDGTISVAALIVCLYFEPKRFILIEEPERNIHPALISRLVGMMKEVANFRKQIVVTTHSPEIVKHAGVDCLLLLSRSPEGFSTVTKPGDNARVKTFLKEEIGVDELYAQELLEG